MLSVNSKTNSKTYRDVHTYKFFIVIFIWEKFFQQTSRATESNYRVNYYIYSKWMDYKIVQLLYMQLPVSLVGYPCECIFPLSPCVYAFLSPEAPEKNVHIVRMLTTSVDFPSVRFLVLLTMHWRSLYSPLLMIQQCITRFCRICECVLN